MGSNYLATLGIQPSTDNSTPSNQTAGAIPSAGGSEYLSSLGISGASSPVSNPENGNPNPEAHDESDRFTQDDPNDNWLEKAWHTANKPLTESLFGWGQYREGAGGLERGVEKVL